MNEIRLAGIDLAGMAGTGRGRSTRIPPVLAALALAASGLTTIACGRSHTDPAKVYKIGYGGDRPLHYRGDDGKPTGLAVSMVQEAARRRGIRLEWVQAAMAMEDLRSQRLDLFVLLTDLPERRNLVHLTTPYLATETAFLVREKSTFHNLGDLASARIAFNNLEVHRLAVARLVPGSVRIPRGSTTEAIGAIHGGMADAAYVDQYAGVIGLLDGAASEPLRIIPSGVPVRQLALASTFESQGPADEIRDEIAKLSENQQLTPVLAHWSMFPVLMSESVDALNQERMKVRALGWGAMVLAILILVFAGLVWRLRQRNGLLAESESRFRTLAETAFEGVMIHDGVRIVEANPQFSQLFGYDSPGELIGSTGRPTILTGESIVKLQDRISGGSNLKPLEIVGIRKDGSHFDIETQGCNSTYRGRKARVVAMRDISERKKSVEVRSKLEAQLAQAQKMETVGRLAGGIAHDFNNLLTVIIGYCSLILNDPDVKGRSRNRVSSIQTAGERAAELTGQLLAFSRRQVIKPCPLDFNALVRETWSLMARLIPANIEVVSFLDEGLPMVMADSGQMHQVVVNLLLNARDAMPEGGRLVLETSRVILDASYADQHPEEVVPGNYVLLAVTDNGIGMEPEVASRIFEPFFTTKPTGAGTGLGLATVYGIVRQSGGWIWVYSEPGKGSTFKVYLPVAESVPVVAETTDSIPSRTGTATILVVEDQENVRELIREILEGKGYGVLVATNGAEALALLHSSAQQIDLLLTDVVMPGISGKELAEQLQREMPGLKVLFMSGYTENVIVNRGILKPGVEFLPKPLTPDSIIANVGRVLGA